MYFLLSTGFTSKHFGEISEVTSKIASVQIPAGNFQMGSPADDPNGLADEVPHMVSLSAFRLSKYEITNLQYAEFLNARHVGINGLDALGTLPGELLLYPTDAPYNWGLNYTDDHWHPAAGFDNYPVVYVSWYGAAEFAAFVGGRLPTEAEWEYACRAGTTSSFNTGNCLSSVDANFDWSAAYDPCPTSVDSPPLKPQQVGKMKANAFGLHDMHGNVSEWCADWYDNYPSPAQTNPTGPENGEYHVYRGGCYGHPAGENRSARRFFAEYGPDPTTGFRVVLLK